MFVFMNQIYKKTSLFLFLDTEQTAFVFRAAEREETSTNISTSGSEYPA